MKCREIAEIAYFSALGKPALVTLTTGRDHDDEMFDAYWFDCSFPNVRVREVEDQVTGFTLGTYHAAPGPSEADIAQGYSDAAASMHSNTSYAPVGDAAAAFDGDGTRVTVATLYL